MKKIILLIIFLSAYGSKLSCQVNQTDSLALVDLYNHTNGPNWFNDSNWLSGPVLSWYGISLTPDGQFVKEIFLPHNNLSEELPSSMGNFTAITNLELSGNNLSGSIPMEMGNIHTLYYLNLVDNNFSGTIAWTSAYFPILNFAYFYGNNLSGAFPGSLMNGVIQVIGLSHNHFEFVPDYSSQTQLIGNFYMDYNNLDFASLEPNISMFLSEGSYLFQDSVLVSMDTTVIQGSTLVLHSRVGGNSNMYLWTKNDDPLWGENDTTLVLQNITFADSGWYSCNITNSVIIDLTLSRKKIHVHVVDSLTPVGPAVQQEETILINWNNTEKLLTMKTNVIAGSYLQAAVFNMQGQKIADLFRGKMKFNEDHYSLTSLKTGLYLVKVVTGSHILTRKFVVHN